MIAEAAQRHRATGSAAARPMGGHRKRLLEPHRALVIDRLKAVPDLTLKALVAELAEPGIATCPVAVWRLVRAEGMGSEQKCVRRGAGAPGGRPGAWPGGGSRGRCRAPRLHAGCAGIGARSLAGDILLHPGFGFMYYASVFTELELEPDKPMEDNPCPAPSCVSMYRSIGRTPCMKFCPAQCLDGEIDDQGRQKLMRYDMAKCAEFTQEYEAVPKILAEAVKDEVRSHGAEGLLDPDRKMLWYKVSAGSGAWFAQCFECMRVCPIATQAPASDPLVRAEAARNKDA